MKNMLLPQRRARCLRIVQNCRWWYHFLTLPIYLLNKQNTRLRACYDRYSFLVVQCYQYRRDIVSLWDEVQSPENGRQNIDKETLCSLTLSWRNRARSPEEMLNYGNTHEVPVDWSHSDTYTFLRLVHLFQNTAGDMWLFAQNGSVLVCIWTVIRTSWSDVSVHIIDNYANRTRSGKFQKVNDALPCCTSLQVILWYHKMIMFMKLFSR